VLSGLLHHLDDGHQIEVGLDHLGDQVEPSRGAVAQLLDVPGADPQQRLGLDDVVIGVGPVTLVRLSHRLPLRGSRDANHGHETKAQR
jgi:hypothetical protein